MPWLLSSESAEVKFDTHCVCAHVLCCHFSFYYYIHVLQYTVDKSTHGFLLNFTSFSRKCRGRIWYILCLCPRPLLSLPFLIPYSCSPIADKSTHGFWTSLPFLSLTHLITQAYVHVEHASQVRDVKRTKKRWSRKSAALAMPEHVQHCYHSLRFNNNGFSGWLIPDKRGGRGDDTVILTMYILVITSSHAGIHWPRQQKLWSSPTVKLMSNPAVIFKPNTR